MGPTVTFLSLFILLVVNCANTQTLSSSSVAQYGCIAPDSTSAFDTFWFLTYVPTPFYVSMGNEHLYRLHAEVFENKAATRAELNAMNLRVTFQANNTVFTQGWGGMSRKKEVFFTQDCTADFSSTDTVALQSPLPNSPLTRARCVPSTDSSSHSSATNLGLVAVAYDRIIWQSKEAEAVLIVRCVTDVDNFQISDWAVLSCNQTLKADVQTEIKQIVTGLGLLF